MAAFTGRLFDPVAQGRGRVATAARIPGRLFRRARIMKLGLINSAWVQAGRGTSYGIRKTREIGFDSIDIFADPLDIDDQERTLIRRECAAAGLPIISVACVAVGLTDFNPSVQRFHLGRVSAYLDMAHEFEARNLLLVLGEYIWQKEVIPPLEQWTTAVGHVRTLGEHAAALGLEIALELEPFELSLLNDVPSMARFLADVDHPAVKANLDISHLALAHQPPSAVEALRGRVAMFIFPIAMARFTATSRRAGAWLTFPLTSKPSSGWESTTRRSRWSWNTPPTRITLWNG